MKINGWKKLREINTSNLVKSQLTNICFETFLAAKIAGNRRGENYSLWQFKKDFLVKSHSASFDSAYSETFVYLTLTILLRLSFQKLMIYASKKESYKSIFHA